MMAAVSIAPGLPKSQMQQSSEKLSPLHDPRSPSQSPTLIRTNTSSPHPDLNGEVAALSDKLIHAINYQTSLDDTLSATRHELQASKARVKDLEDAAQRQQRLVADGHSLRKVEVDDHIQKLLSRVTEEKKQRTTAEKEKRMMEQELENLTTSLFEEANKMVAEARRDREAAERRTEQVRAQLNDTELLLASHQEQLAELKNVMQDMASDRDDPDTTASTAPSTPALPSNNDFNKVFEALHISPGSEGVAPAPPTSFSHLLSPVLRTDVQSYEDFRSLLQLSRTSTPPSRVTSGSYSGLNIMNATSSSHRDQVTQGGRLPSNGSATSLSTSVTQSSATTTSNTPASAVSSVPSRDAYPSAIPLKETRFYKRALSEDIEPSLRLDTAPGLSWLARRTVINSMCEGSLVIEPMPPSAKSFIFSCALCGENRKGEELARNHRFRTSENDNAQRYPLCAYCLNRMRATCDFLGFLRMIKDGHWRTEGAESEKIAWEESVRLRERMFWARIGGGCVPAFTCARDSPRPSVEDPTQPLSAPPFLRNEALGAKVHSSQKAEDLHRSKDKLVEEPYKVPVHRREYRDDDDWETAKEAAIFDDISSSKSPQKLDEDDPASKQLQTDLRASLKKISVKASHEERSDPSSAPSEQQHLSTKIPGSFNF